LNQRARASKSSHPGVNTFFQKQPNSGHKPEWHAKTLTCIECTKTLSCIERTKMLSCIYKVNEEEAPTPLLMNEEVNEIIYKMMFFNLIISRVQKRLSLI
jgi:hypothetical protein